MSEWTEAKEFRRARGEHVKQVSEPAKVKLPRQSLTLQVKGLLISCGLGLEVSRPSYAHYSIYRIVTRSGAPIWHCRSLAAVIAWVEEHDFEVGWG